MEQVSEMTYPIDVPPPPPNAQNDMRQPQGNDGVFLPLQQLQGLAKMWTAYRPLIGWGAKLARQKIPRELDDALEAIAATGNPQALKELQQRDMQQPGQWQPPPGPGYEGEVPENEPGTPVMTHTLAEEAYYLHTVKGWGVRQIAQELTNRGNPVSKATVARYVDDIEQEMSEEHGQRWRRALSGGMIFLAWLGSAFAFNILLKFLHVI